MAINPFAFFDSASSSKEDLLKQSGVTEKEYVPFLVNRAFSLHPDTVHYAQDMNMYPDLDKKMQYHYYLHGVPARKRFAKWPKPAASDDMIKFVQFLFNCNTQRANEYFFFLDKKKLMLLKDEYNRSH